jgi:MFS family permease
MLTSIQSEFYGRRWIFHISFLLYIAFGFLCAFTPNFAGLLAGRFITGTAVSAALTNAPGIIADIWDPVERYNAMILFSVVTFVGPALGPVVSGFLRLKETWRWTFYVLLWMAGGTELMLITLPETLPAIVLLNKSHRLRKKSSSAHVRAPVEAEDRTLMRIFKAALTRPWILLFDTISFLIAIYYAVVYTLLYMLFAIYPIVFQQKRGWNTGVGELPLIGTVIGAVLGGLALYIFALKNQKDSTQKKKPPTPEDRLPGAMAGAVLLVVSVFWFAWTAEYNSIHWIVPTIAGVFLAAAILLIFVVLINYVIDSYEIYAASAVAANTVLRSACAASSPLFTDYMFNALGVGSAGSLIGGIAVLLLPIPFVFRKYGAALRARSKYATTDKRPNSHGNEQADSDDGVV